MDVQGGQSDNSGWVKAARADGQSVEDAGG